MEEELNNGGSSEMQPHHSNPPHSQFHNALQQQQQQQHSSPSAASSSSNYNAGSFYTLNSNPNPNNSILLENPSLQLDPSSNIDPYAAVISYNNTHVGGEGEYAAQATAMAYSQQPTQTGVYSEHAYLQNPSSIVQYGVDPAAYSAEIKSLDENTIVPTKSSPKESNVIKTKTCEVCMIDCKNKKALDRHKKGKKHRMNVAKQAELSKDSTTTSNTPTTLETTEEKGFPVEDTKIMQAGASNNSVVVCNVCKVTCNSESVFQNHIAGKKHAAQVKKQELGKDSTALAISKMPTTPETTTNRGLPGEDLETEKQSSMEDGEINSAEHAAQVKKEELGKDSTASAISKMPTTPETTKNRSLPGDDLETEKQSSMEDGEINSAEHAAQVKKEELGKDSTASAISKMPTTPETTKNRSLPGDDLETEKQSSMADGEINSAEHAAQVKKEELGKDSTASAISKMPTTPETTKNRSLPGDDLETEKQNSMEDGEINSAKHAAQAKKEELGKDSTAPAISKMLTTPETDKNRGLPGEDLETEKQSSMEDGEINSAEHAAQVKKEELGKDSTASAISKMLTTPETDKNRGLPGEDLETEKQNAMEGAVNSGRVCTICKVTCSSQLEFEYHITGKKHATQVKKEELGKDSTALVISEIPSTPKKTKKQGLPGEDLETKKRKIMESGTAVSSVVVCTICEVVCNSQSAFNFHLAGKKHAVQAGLTPPNGIEQMMPTKIQMMPTNLNLDSDFMSTAPMVQSPTTRPTEKEPKEIKIVQSAWCEICKISCTTKDVLDIHKAGKKHKKNLKKLEEPNNPSADDATSTNPITGPQENTNNPSSSSSSVEVQQTNKRPSSSTLPAEDVETKRRKLLEVGATEDSVRVCTICNIVVNSETVFSYHLAGQKHASMVKKQADGTTATAAAATGPEAVTVG